MNSERLLLITLLLNLGVMAAIAAVLVRSRAFQRCLFHDRRSLRQTVAFALFVALPLMGGVWIRLAVPSFRAADLTLAGSLLIGMMGGGFAGVLGGAIIGLPALLGGGELLALPVAVAAGVAGGLLRRAAPTGDEVWAFSPFIDLELWRWLRNRLNRWQALVFAVVIGGTLAQLELKRMWPHALFAPEPHALGTGAAVVAANILLLAIPLKIWDNTRIERKLAEQQRLLVEARLEALTRQINPHFLFNTLNSVASLVRFDPDTARVLIVKLSNILRRMLRKHESFHPLRDELAFIDDYLDIEVVRFGPDKLRVVKEIEPGTLDLLVPSMVLQPMVENSIRHGLAPKVEGGGVWLRARRRGEGRREWIELEVEDNGVGMPGAGAIPSGHGIGLTNVRERLQVLYGDAARVEMLSRAGEGTRVVLRLPLVENDAAAAVRSANTSAGAGASAGTGEAGLSD